MNRAIAPIAITIAAPAAVAQSWEFELSRPVLQPGAASTEVVLTLDPGPGAYAVAGVNFDVHASEAGWSGLNLRIPYSAGGGPDPGGVPGSITGPSVIGASARQLPPQLGFTPDPGRIEIWGATFTVTDFTARTVDLSTETSRLEVYTVDPGTVTIPLIHRVTPVEGAGAVQVIPAPAALALLGVGGLAAARRRR